MAFELRQYQKEAVEAGNNFFADKKSKANGILICPTGSGKSLIIANIAMALEGKTIIFQPSREILIQNLQKFTSYGYRAGVYSASAGSKFIDKITFATIGSVAKKHHLFKDVEHVIIDECHITNSKGGMLHDFIKMLPNAKVLGLTATPYRLSSSNPDSAFGGGTMLKFLIRTSPRIFSKVLYAIQNDILFDAGYLCKLEYYPINIINRKKLSLNSIGSDFTEASLKSYYRMIHMTSKTIEYSNRLLVKRKNLLVFCSLVDDAVEVSKGIPGSYVLTGETPTALRERILQQFKAGIIKCIVNVGVLTTGFDYPALEAILIARSTMSLALYYQMIGRGMRPSPGKENCWVVDLGGNYDFFGPIETMKLMQNEKGLHSIWNKGRQLTNVIFTK